MSETSSTLKPKGRFLSKLSEVISTGGLSSVFSRNKAEPAPEAPKPQTEEALTFQRIGSTALTDDWKKFIEETGEQAETPTSVLGIMVRFGVVSPAFIGGYNLELDESTIIDTLDGLVETGIAAIDDEGDYWVSRRVNDSPEPNTQQLA